MTLKQFAEQNNLRLELHRVPFRIAIDMTEWEKSARHFLYKIYCFEGENYGKEITGWYSQGSAVKHIPKIEDILDSLMLDTQSIEESCFEEWASDCGYGIDSIKAFATYKECLHEAKQLKHLLGYSLYRELHECEQL